MVQLEHRLLMCNKEASSSISSFFFCSSSLPLTLSILPPFVFSRRAFQCICLPCSPCTLLMWGSTLGTGCPRWLRALSPTCPHTASGPGRCHTWCRDIPCSGRALPIPRCRPRLTRNSTHKLMRCASGEDACRLFYFVTFLRGLSLNRHSPLLQGGGS